MREVWALCRTSAEVCWTCPACPAYFAITEALSLFLIYPGNVYSDDLFILYNLWRVVSYQYLQDLTPSKMSHYPMLNICASSPYFRILEETYWDPIFCIVLQMNCIMLKQDLTHHEDHKYCKTGKFHDRKISRIRGVANFWKVVIIHCSGLQVLIEYVLQDFLECVWSLQHGLAITPSFGMTMTIWRS